MAQKYILGISAFYHDAAAALLKDGEIIAAAQEERFTRKKHDPSFPEKAIEYCLKEAGIQASDIDIVAFYEGELKDSSKKFKNIISEKLRYKGRILFFEHNYSHASSAFYPSPFKEAAVVVVDGYRPGVTTSFGKGSKSGIEFFKEVESPHSLGALYSAFTQHCGFKINSGEYKLMGLAPYGEPTYVNDILGKLINVNKDGTIKIKLDYFDFHQDTIRTSDKFWKLFGSTPRKSHENIEKKHLDLARSIQVVTEEAIIKMAEDVQKKTGLENLCMSGDVALNCVSNGKLLEKGLFKDIWIQPASSDAGCALGAALSAWHDYLGMERNADTGKDAQKGTLLGPSFTDREIEAFLEGEDLEFQKISYKEIPEKIAGLLKEQKVIGIFQGRMEFGPRALGSRSIIADPRSLSMQGKINSEVKLREPFRPFAPSVLSENINDYFEIKRESPYMLFTTQLKKDKRVNEKQANLSRGLDKLNIRRSVVPSVTHIDYSVRVQTLTRSENGLFYDIVKEFYKLSGCPMVLNTSFNLMGEPVVCTPQDAYRTFKKSSMDYLLIGSFVVSKRVKHNKNADLERVKELELV